jgi:hypothetical protein
MNGQEVTSSDWLPIPRAFSDDLKRSTSLLHIIPYLQDKEQILLKNFNLLAELPGLGSGIMAKTISVKALELC